jgi:hypothetical protein
MKKSKKIRCSLCRGCFIDIEEHILKCHNLTFKDYELKLKKEFIECRICGNYFKNVQTHVWRSHKIKFLDYKKKYNLSNKDCFPDDYLTDVSEKFKGHKNPGYQHGGKLSPFSRNFIGYKDKSNKQINEILNKHNINRRIKLKDGGSKRTIGYWIKNYDMTEDEAKEAVSKHQLNFSLDICVCKHGILNGYTIWLDRQERWQETLNTKTQKETDALNLRKSKFIKNTETPKDFISEVIRRFENLTIFERESFSFKFWLNSFIILDMVIRFWFDDNINNLYNEIPNYIKNSFKNNKKIFKNKGKFNCFNMYTERNELLRSSGEIEFYFLLIFFINKK